MLREAGTRRIQGTRVLKSFSVPIDLVDRMQECRDVNWSKMISDAIRFYLRLRDLKEDERMRVIQAMTNIDCGHREKVELVRAE